MQDKQFFGLVERYRAEHPEIQRLLKVLDEAQPHLVQLEELERQQQSIITRTSTTSEGVYSSPAIPGIYITDVGLTTEGEAEEAER